MVYGTEYLGEVELQWIVSVSLTSPHMVHGTEYDGAEYDGEVELQWIVGVSLTSPHGTWYWVRWC